MTWHVTPLGDLRDHEESPECWCKPVKDEETEAIWIHNSMDRREHTIEKGITQ